jgi:hypothetical protein
VPAGGAGVDAALREPGGIAGFSSFARAAWPIEGRGLSVPMTGSMAAASMRFFNANTRREALSCSLCVHIISWSIFDIVDGPKQFRRHQALPAIVLAARAPQPDA